MAKDSPSSGDFLFRDGQAWFGTQEGKRNEMVHDMLEQERAQTELMRDMIEQQRKNEMTAPSNQSQMVPVNNYYPQYVPPVISLHGLCEELRPQFQNLFEAQRELGGKVDTLGYVGQMALQESVVHTGLMEKLNEEARVAFHQRNAELQRLGEAVVSSRVANLQLSGIDRGISRVDQGISRMDGNVNYSVNRAAYGISRSVGLSTAILSSDIHHLESSLASALGDIGFDISHLTHEVVQTRLEVIEALQDAQAIFLWSHREQMWVRKQILDVLRKPRQTAAREAWQIGEKCRLAGDEKEAERMYRESLIINPSESRNHISLGLISLNRGETETAKQNFSSGSLYADEAQLKSVSLMYLAKIGMFEKDHANAKELLDSALKADVTNLEVWFDLAVCEMKSGNRQRALYFIENLLHAPLRIPRNRVREAAQYALKIVAETAFAPLMSDIRRIMREIINNPT